ncbi:MAG: hypothetical protein NTY74_02755 [Ignavibacteriae bacterium]|nr:hypothetical protein [Ignavibacteriota bacterium]
MNRIIKSQKEIQSEIKSIFTDFKTEKILVSRIKGYINNISGKELISKEFILHLFVNEIAILFKRKELDLRSNKQLLKLLPFIQFIGSRFNVIEKSDKNFDKQVKDVCEHHALTNLPYEIISNYRDFKKYAELDYGVRKTSNLLSKENSSFSKFLSFIRSNPDVACFLDDFLYDYRKNYIFELVANKIIALNSILIYFDSNKNIKENTQEFYVLLKKKIPRHTIQAAIQDNLNKIKEDKFHLQPTFFI